MDESQSQCSSYYPNSILGADGKTAIDIKIYQGEQELVQDNKLLSDDVLCSDLILQNNKIIKCEGG
jgi:molecular chaperone DnaK (HSP70)